MSDRYVRVVFPLVYIIAFISSERYRPRPHSSIKRRARFARTGNGSVPQVGQFRTENRCRKAELPSAPNIAAAGVARARLTGVLRLQRPTLGDWDKVPYVPRPSLVPDPVTAFGRRSRPGTRSSILEPVTRQNIVPKPESKLRPLAPYVSPREQTRARVLSTVAHRERALEAEPLGTPRDHMDLLLAQAHGLPQHTARRHVFYSNYASY